MNTHSNYIFLKLNWFWLTHISSETYIIPLLVKIVMYSRTQFAFTWIFKETRKNYFTWSYFDIENIMWEIFREWDFKREIYLSEIFEEIVWLSKWKRKIHTQEIVVFSLRHKLLAKPDINLSQEKNYKKFRRQNFTRKIFDDKTSK